MAAGFIVTSLDNLPARGNRVRWENADVGRKAMGLDRLPATWCPPFVVLTTKAYRLWAATKNDHSVDANFAITRLFEDTGLRNTLDTALGTEMQTVLVRSSAPGEDLHDRGRYNSEACQNRDKELTDTVSRLWLAQSLISGELALILQPCIKWVLRGHLSNERRLSRTAQEWVCEYENEEHRSAVRPIVSANDSNSTRPPLSCINTNQLWHQLSGVAGIGARVWGRMHYEWLWDGNRLWIVQQDNEEPRPGVTPGSLAQRTSDGSPSAYDTLVRWNDSKGTWHKIDCLRLFDQCGLATVDVYVLENPNIIQGLMDGAPDTKLMSDIRRLITGPSVVRTDVDKGTGYQSTLLPRTDSLREADEVIRFLMKTAMKLGEAGLNASQFCFLLHNYVNARASSLSRASPESQVVKIDASWGNADGLMYYPHDSFEVVLGQRHKIRSRLRCKSEYIDCDQDGRWTEREAGMPWDWEPSLTRADTINIAEATKKVADRLTHAVEVMHFVGVDIGEQCPICLPWYYDDASKGMSSTQPGTIAPRLGTTAKCSDSRSTMSQGYASLPSSRSLKPAQIPHFFISNSSRGNYRRVQKQIVPSLVSRHIVAMQPLLRPILRNSVSGNSLRPKNAACGRQVAAQHVLNGAGRKTNERPNFKREHVPTS